MSTSAVDGLVSGLDTTTLINQLMQLESQPQARLVNSLGRQDTTITSLRSVSTKLAALTTALDKVANASTWTAVKAKVDGTNVVANATSSAFTGTLAISVTSLAAPGTWTTDASYSLDAVVGSAALTVTKPDGTVVNVDPPSGTLREVIGAINNAADLGVRAVAVKTGNDSYRLQIVSFPPGTDNQPQGIGGLTVPVTAVAATNAQYSVNGIPGQSSTNTISDLVPGLTVTLPGTGTSRVTVDEDIDAISTAVGDLVVAANAAIAEVKAQTAAGKDGTGRGTLAGDSLVRGLTANITRAFSDAVGGLSPATIGIQTTREGTITFDTAAFVKAYNNDPDAVRAMVSPADGSTAIARRLKAVVESATSSSTGFIAAAIEGRESTKRDLQTQIESWDRRLELRRATLTTQFTALEVSLGRMQSQSSWLSGQISRLNAGSG